MGNPTKMDDSEVPLFQETSIFCLGTPEFVDKLSSGRFVSAPRQSFPTSEPCQMIESERCCGGLMMNLQLFKPLIIGIGIHLFP